MKRKGIFSIMLAVMLLAITAATIYARDARILVDGQFLDVNGVVMDGHTLLPVRALAETVGADVEWLEEARQVRIEHGDNVISLTIDSASAIVNNETITLDIPAQIIDGLTLLPLRFISENLGLEVDWIPEPATVIMRSDNSPYTLQELRDLALGATGLVTGPSGEAHAPPAESALIGTWFYLGHPDYDALETFRFDADGRGETRSSGARELNRPIRWIAENGILEFCITPLSCGDTCISPMRWYYMVDGDELTIIGATMSIRPIMTGMTFAYSRG